MYEQMFDENGIPILTPGAADGLDVGLLDAPVKRSALPKARAKTGMVTNTVSPPPVAPPAPPQGAGGGLPLAMGAAPFGAPGYESGAFDKSDELRRRAFDSLTPSDEEMDKGRHQSMLGTIAGMAMQTMGSDGMREAGGSMLKQAMAQQAKYDADPFKQAEIKSRRMIAEADMWDKRAAASVNHAERAAAREQAADLRREGFAMQQQIASLAAGGRNERAQGAADQRTFQRTQSLSGEYNKAMGDITDTLFSARKIAGMSTKGMTAQDQMGMIFNFMKALDPGSVVRESEYAAAAKARGLFDTIKHYPEYLRSGKPLTPTQVENMQNVGKQMEALMTEMQREHNAHYRGKAQRWGVDPTDILRGEKMPDAPPGASPAGSARSAADEILKGR